MPTRLDDLKRASKVVRVLYKHGLGDIIKKAGLTWHLHLFDRHRKIKGLPPDLPQKLTAAIEELGGAYIKLGQLLSIRPDLIPPEYCEQFSKLQDNVKPEPFEAIQQVIEKELKKPIDKLFTHIDKEPLGSASIAQVHKARLLSGKAAVVKVQKPQTREEFETDIDILKYLAKKFEQHIADHISLNEIVEEFEKYTKKELDFKVEAANIDMLRSTVQKNPKITVPKVYWDYTTSNVITMDYLEGIKICEIKQKALRQEIAKALIDTTLVQVFEKGVFHADLHPGNILLLKDHRIGLLDFGIVGRIDQNTIKLGVSLYQAIMEKDEQQITNIILKYGSATHDTDLDSFKEDVRDLLDTWRGEAVTRLLYKLFLICSYNNIKLPRNTVLLGKALVTAEGTAKKLDPDFDFVSYAKEKVVKILKQQRTPAKIVERFAKRSEEISDALTALPRESLELIQTIKRGRATLEIDDTKFRRIGFDINNSSNRLSYALIAASFIVAGSQLHEVPPFAGAYSVPVIVMYSIASIFVILLVSSVAREPRRRQEV